MMVTTRFSLCLHDTLFVDTTMTCRLTDTPGVYELVAQYGVGDRCTGLVNAAFVRTIPSGLYVWRELCTAEQHVERSLWVHREGEALLALLKDNMPV